MMEEMIEETFQRSQSVDDQIAVLQLEIEELTTALQKKEIDLHNLRNEKEHLDELLKIKCPPKNFNGLTPKEVSRYSRQMILPNFGVKGQQKLSATSFLIVGMGGLGCPAAQYLAAAGCGRLGLMDYDYVENSNISRQILHNENRIGKPKVESAFVSLHMINSKCHLDVHKKVLAYRSALEIIPKYDIILDCTDNVPTRYLLNDACVRLGKPLVSGSALKMDGQLSVYNYGSDGPCYRCIFPVPPPPDTVNNCQEAGILGVITGVIGALQALEAIKIALNGLGGEVLSGRLLVFDGAQGIFRCVRLRGRRPNCVACSGLPIMDNMANYESFCGVFTSDRDYSLELLPPGCRISVYQYDDLRHDPHLLIDVRQTAEYELCHLPNSINIPLKSIIDGSYMKDIEEHLQGVLTIYVICRRGNDSQIAVGHLRRKYPDVDIRDIIGGLHAWHSKIDKTFPYY